VALAQDPGQGRRIAAHLLEVAAEDLVLRAGQFSVKGSPNRSKTIQDVPSPPTRIIRRGWRRAEAVSYYDPPNLTYPFGSYICVVDIDKGTGEVKVRRFLATTTAGNIIQSP